jgi:hypothetical protein
MPVVVITILLVILSVFIVVNGTLPYETIPLVIVPTPTPAMTPSITTVPTQPPVTNEGVWVRIVSEEGYTGQAGNPEFLEKVSGSGERFFKVHDSSDLVKVAVTKLRNSGSKLTVEIIRDGKTIASRSTTAPMGSVDLLIDPATGAAPGMTTTTPAAETTGAGHLEYL